jgi:hypothetical protein
MGDAQATTPAAHSERAAAIRDVFERVPSERFTINTPYLEDSQPQRLLELFITSYTPFDPTTPMLDGSLAQMLDRAGTHPGLAQAIAMLTEIIRAEQEARRLGRVEFHLADGNRVRCEPSAPPQVIRGSSPPLEAPQW